MASIRPWLAACVVSVGLVACGHGSAAGSSDTLRLALLPNGGDTRQQALHESGGRLYLAMAEGRPEEALVDELSLRHLVDGSSASRYAARRATVGMRLGVRPADFQSFRDAEYVGLCAQGAHERPAQGVLGLLAPTWSLERVLLVGRQAGGRRVAAWLEGVFVYTNQGFFALDLSRAEAPRWEHSDLELASCDLEVGVH